MIATTSSAVLDSPVRDVEPGVRRRERILLVDDDPITVRLQSGILARSGFTVASSPDGAAALERLQRERFDAIVLDVGLPDLDGYEIARRIGRLPPGARGPVIMVTATADRDALQRGFAAGAILFLAKPFTAMTFRTTVEAALLMRPPDRRPAE